MAEKVLTIARRDSDGAEQAASEFATWAKGRGLGVVELKGDEAPTAAALKDVRLGVVFGGDGTFLSLVRRLPQKDQFPILGVNRGSLGFITEISPEEVHQTVEKALKGELNERKRFLLDVELYRGGKLVQGTTVLNEAAITKDARTHMLRMEIFVQGEFFNRVGADGYIVSTPTGSTAYALSAGGPIIQPEVNGIVLVPVCSHALSARSVVIPHDWDVEMVLESVGGKVYLVWDGQVNQELQTGDRIRFKSSEMQLRMIQTSPKRWAETLRDKLHLR